MSLKGTGEPPSMLYVAKGNVFAVPFGTIPYQLTDVPAIVPVRT